MKTKFLMASLFIFICTSCGMFSKRVHETQSEKAAKVNPTPAPSAPEVTKESSPEPVAPAVVHEEKHAPFTKPTVAAETSLKWLVNGNTRFVKKTFRADGRSEKDLARLTLGQHPHAIVLACSDSRVPPEIIFDQTLGEIYVVRVLGEALDTNVIASIEYAVEHFHTGLLVVLGHSQCGAIQATLKAGEGESSTGNWVDHVIADINPRLATMKNEPASANLEVEATLNADGVARDLVKRSSILKDAVETGNLSIKSALYRVDSGKVTFY